MSATNIDDVLRHLDRILEGALRHDDRIGYFVALYRRVTWAVKRAIIAGDVFDDDERMDHFDTVFANRFLEAWAADGTGDWLSSPWAQAFEALDRDDLMVVQHLALGMNAHINLDLGIAAQQVMAERGEPLSDLQDDFERINDVLARLTRVVQVQLAQLSKGFDVLDDIAPDLQASLFGKVLDGLRADAWAFAERLDEAEGDGEWDRLVDERSVFVEDAGGLILLPIDFAEFVSGVVADEHLNAVRTNIRLLAE